MKLGVFGYYYFVSVVSCNSCYDKDWDKGEDGLCKNDFIGWKICY